jgi:Transglutaminase-like superfamily
MSILVIRGASASASASPSRGSTVGAVTARRATLRDFDDAGAALVEVQDTLLASLPSSEGAQHGGSGCLSTSSAPAPHKKPPLFSLRNWFAPRPTHAASSSASASSRTGHAHALSMTATASSTSTTSLGSLSAASILCAETLPALLVEEPTALQHALEEQIEVHEPADTFLPSSSSAAIAVEKPPVESVHLQLTGLAPDPPPASELRQNNQTMVRVHSYVHTDGSTYVALNTPKHKFASFLAYLNLTAGVAADKATIQTKRVVYDAQVRQEWRELWKRRQLLTDRTELLAVYPSDSKPSTDPSVSGSSSAASSSASSGSASDAPAAGKRGGFADLLHLYTERFAGILADEQQLHQVHGKSMLAWLQDAYGYEATRTLQSDAFRQLSEPDQMQTLQSFLEWFRSRFPYFYDRCGSCGASMKEDLAHFQHDHHDNSPVPPVAQDDKDDDNEIVFTCQDDAPTSGDDNDDDDEDMEESSEYQTFIGYIYPSDDELVGKASRTELYRCHVCHDFTRFPRFNSAWHVLEQQRGRCGEYSMLLYRFLRALGHPCRWVVDWSDHVWAEIRIGARWVHLDPCEAAVDQNLLYQDWGKKQTYILGFAAPTRSVSWLAGDDIRVPLIEDITSTYTSDAWETICQRRDESETEVKDAIEKAASDLRCKLPTKEEEAVAEPIQS